jgi:Uma2 family endonuclease
MAMPAARTEWTVEMLDDLPEDGNRYEIIDGELFVTPAPSSAHQLTLGALYARLRAYMRPGSIGRVFLSPADVRREDRRRNRVQPDIFAVRLTDGSRPAYPFDLADLLIVIEVESPGNSRYDYQVKRALYLAEGVPEYWIVNADTRTIARWRGPTDAGEILTSHIEWHPPGMPEPFTLDFEEFFEDALG